MSFLDDAARQESAQVIPYRNPQHPLFNFYRLAATAALTGPPFLLVIIFLKLALRARRIAIRFWGIGTRRKRGPVRRALLAWKMNSGSRVQARDDAARIDGTANSGPVSTVLIALKLARRARKIDLRFRSEMTGTALPIYPPSISYNVLFHTPPNGSLVGKA